MARDSTVTVIISKGPEMVTVPGPLKGLTYDEASTKLGTVGLSAVGQGYAPGKKVQASNPSPGDSVAKGTVVTLFF